jgi:HK97 gp10 family phage protein
MPVEVKVNTKGLDALSSSLSPAMVDRMVRAAGFEAEGKAKRKAPIDTGFLRGSIRNKPMGGGVTEVGASAEYAPYVELGTRRMKAQPYLEPAIKESVDNLRRALEAIFKRAQR